MMLNIKQLESLKQFLVLVHLNENTKADAAALVGVSASTLRRWQDAGNAPSVDAVIAEHKKKLKAQKDKDRRAAKKNGVVKAPVKKVAAKKSAAPGGDKIETLNQELLKKVVNVVAEQLGLPTADIKPASKFVADLGADSLDTVELVMALEDEFDIEVPDEEADKIKTVSDAVKLIQVMTDKKNGSTANFPFDERRDEDKLVNFQAIITGKTLTIVRDGVPVQLDKNHTNYTQIKDLIASELKNGQIRESVLNKINGLIDIKVMLNEYSDGRIKVVKGAGVSVDGKPLAGRLAAVMLRELEGGPAGVERFAKFHTKLLEALSFKITTRLFDFVSRSGLNIADDGDILAVKVVRSDFKDKHSGTMDNSPGKTVEVPRNQVDDDEDRTCSNGLHVAAPAYIGHFGSRSGGDRVILVKVDPRDFVAIPKDYSATKARVSKYVVLREVTSTDELNKIWESAKTITSKA